MNEQKNKARQAWTGSGDKQNSAEVIKSLGNIKPTVFSGYEKYELDTKVELIIKDQKIINKVSSKDRAEIIFNETVFYAESGGQISDTGTIIGKNFKANVISSKKFKTGNDKTIFICLIDVLSGELTLGDKVSQLLDIEKRKHISSHHSATHLLHEALRQKLGLHVAQKGSLVTNQKLRFDFSHIKPISENDLKEIEDEVNFRIMCNEDVNTKIMTPDEAIKTGAIALFGEKYGDKVRVVSIGKNINPQRNAWSVELCGGTHVNNTAEISTFKIVAETGVSSGIRRIEAVTSLSAIKFYNDEVDKVKYIANFLKTNPSQVIKKIEQLVFDNKNTTNELIALKKKVISSEENLSNKENLNGVSFEYKIFEDLSIKDLKPTAEIFLKKNQSGIVCLISKIDNKASLVIAVDKMIISKFNAVDMVNFISKILGGKGGGGRPDMAQSGGSLPENSELAIKKLKDYINNIV